MIRSTRQKAHMQSVLDEQDAFFSAEEFHRQVAKKNVSIATVYRFLAEQQKQGELYAYQCDRRTIYSKGHKSHCHFICENTGKTLHFTIDNLDFLKDKIPGTIHSFQIEVRGTCTTCSKK